MVELRPKQIEDVGFLIREEKGLLLHDPGTGKTPPVCVWLYYLWIKLGHKSIWVMPKSLLAKNKAELLRFTDFESEDVAILEEQFLSPSPSEARSLAKFLARGKGRFAKRFKPYPQFWSRLAEGEVINLITECEAKVILCGFRYLTRFHRELLYHHPEIRALAVDELHMAYGGTESANTAAFYAVMRHCTHFVGMTGTLLNGRLDSVFPAIHVVEPRYYGSFRGFMHEHAAFTDNFGRVLTWKNEVKVGQILLRHGRRRTFEEEYGKEDVLFIPQLINMNPKMREVYDDFHNQAMLELEDGTFLDGALPGVAVIRARQIMAHPETMGLCKGEETGKDEWLRIQIEDAIATRISMLLFSVHIAEQHRLVRLLESMGRKVALMNGDTSSARRIEIDRAFCAREIDDVIGSPETMAVGWNWEHVDHVIPVSYTYGDVDFLQAYRRASRGTRTKALRVTIPQYEDSIEARVLEIIRGKSILANRVDPTRPVLNLAA